IKDIESLFETDDFSKEMHEKWISFLEYIYILDKQSPEGEYSRLGKLFDSEVISIDTAEGIVAKHEMKLLNMKKGIIGKYSKIPDTELGNLWSLQQYKIGIQINTLYDSIPILMFTYGYYDYTTGISIPNLKVPFGLNNLFSRVNEARREHDLSMDDEMIMTIFSQYAGEDSITLADFILDDDNSVTPRMRFIDKIYMLFFCMTENLKLLYDKIGFLHRDLNFGNLLIKKFSTEREFPMKWGNENYIFRSDIMPFIIDYGFSSSKKDIHRENSI